MIRMLTDLIAKDLTIAYALLSCFKCEHQIFYNQKISLSLDLFYTTSIDPSRRFSYLLISAVSIAIVPCLQARPYFRLIVLLLVRNIPLYTQQGQTLPETTRFSIMHNLLLQTIHTIGLYVEKGLTLMSPRYWRNICKDSQPSHTNRQCDMTQFQIRQVFSLIGGAQRWCLYFIFIFTNLQTIFCSSL